MFVHKLGFLFCKPITWLLFFKPIIGLFAFAKPINRVVALLHLLNVVNLSTVFISFVSWQFGYKL